MDDLHVLEIDFMRKVLVGTFAPILLPYALNVLAIQETGDMAGLF